jgi:hypothetical protein
MRFAVLIGVGSARWQVGITIRPRPLGIHLIKKNIGMAGSLVRGRAEPSRPRGGSSIWRRVPPKPRWNNTCWQRPGHSWQWRGSCSNAAASFAPRAANIGPRESSGRPLFSRLRAALVVGAGHCTHLDSSVYPFPSLCDRHLDCLAPQSRSVLRSKTRTSAIAGRATWRTSVSITADAWRTCIVEHSLGGRDRKLLSRTRPLSDLELSSAGTRKPIPRRFCSSFGGTFTSGGGISATRSRRALPNWRAGALESKYY